MVSVKNRYRKTLFKVKGGKILNQGGQQLATVVENGLEDTQGQKIVEINDMQVISISDGSVLASVQGSSIVSPEGSVLGYVDGIPVGDFTYGAAALVMFAY